MWDSGSQVSIVDEVWKEMHLPHTTLRDISEILDRADPLDIVAANGENMLYVGWVEVTSSLASGGAPTTLVKVPALVMKGDKLGRPIIGPNVIELIIGSELKQSNATDRECLRQVVKTAFPNLEREQAQAFVQ